MSNISLQKFTVGEKVYIVNNLRNTEYNISETTVSKVGRLYVTVDRFDLKYKMINEKYNFLYNIDFGSDSYLFLTRKDAEDFITKIMLIVNIKDVVRSIDRYGSDYSVDELQAILDIVRKRGKTVQELITDNSDKEVHLIDGAGVFGELPLTENNLKHVPDRIEVDGNVMKLYVE